MLEDATFLLTNGRRNSAVDRAYYAMVHSSQAALVGAVQRQPKSHAGLRALLGQHLVQSGRVERIYAEHLSRAFDLRQRSTYDPEFVVENERANAAVTTASTFISRMRRVVEESA